MTDVSIGSINWRGCDDCVHSDEEEGGCAVPIAQWQVLEDGRLVAHARAQTTVRVEEWMQLGTIYDRTGTVVLATTVNRDRLVG